MDAEPITFAGKNIEDMTHPELVALIREIMPYVRAMMDEPDEEQDKVVQTIRRAKARAANR